jgi:hypothetical protein
VKRHTVGVVVDLVLASPVMQRSATIRRMTGAVVLVLALAACGGGSDSGAGGEPSDSGADTSVTLHFPDDLEPVCRGTGAAFATPYDPAAAGIHTTVMLAGADVDDLSETSSSLNPEWIPTFSEASDEYASTQLVVCSLRTASVLAEECTGYESDGESTDNVVHLYSATYQFELRAATTAEVLGQTTVEAAATECPSFVMFDADSNSEDWYEDADDQIIDFVKPYVVTA